MEFPIDLRFAEAAYTTLKECDPGRLKLVTLLISEGETPQTIFERMTEKKPDYVALPMLCAGAAHWIIYQKNSN
jgi:hypothetical protein